MKEKRVERGILWVLITALVLVLGFPKEALAQDQTDAGASQADAGATTDGGTAEPNEGQVVRTIVSGNTTVQVVDPNLPATPPPRNARVEGVRPPGGTPSINGWTSNEVPPPADATEVINLPNDPTAVSIIGPRGGTDEIARASVADFRAYRRRLRIAAENFAPVADPVQRGFMLRRMQCSAACYDAHGDPDAAMQALCVQHNWPAHVSGFGERVSCVGAMAAFLDRQSASIAQARLARDSAQAELELYRREVAEYDARIAQLQRDLDAARANQGSPERIRELETQLADARTQLAAAQARVAEAETRIAEAEARSQQRTSGRATGRRRVAQAGNGGQVVHTGHSTPRRVRHNPSTTVRVSSPSPGGHAYTGDAPGPCRRITRNGQIQLRCQSGNGTDPRHYARQVGEAIRRDRQAVAASELSDNRVIPVFRPAMDESALQGGLVAFLEANPGRILLACRTGNHYFWRRFGVQESVNHDVIPTTLANFRTFAPSNCGLTQVWIPNHEIVFVPLESAPTPTPAPGVQNTSARRSTATRRPPASHTPRVRLARNSSIIRAEFVPGVRAVLEPHADMILRGSPPARAPRDLRVALADRGKPAAPLMKPQTMMVPGWVPPTRRTARRLSVPPRGSEMGSETCLAIEQAPKLRRILCDDLQSGPRAPPLRI
jgi:hypothetical protein